MKVTQTFKTLLINRRVAETVEVHERDGSIFVNLEPGITYEAESVNPETLYSRFSSVTWNEGGKVSFVERTNFRQPDLGRWVLHCLNKDGAGVEFRHCGGEVRQVPDEDPLHAVTTGNVKKKPTKAEVVGGQRICLPKGIPVLVSCPLTSDLIMFQSLTIVRKKIQVKSDDFVGYCATRWVLRDEKEPRADSELKALAKILDDLGKEKS